MSPDTPDLGRTVDSGFSAELRRNSASNERDASAAHVVELAAELAISPIHRRSEPQRADGDEQRGEAAAAA
jgi:phage terminase small subunit